jgi:hypothetical protein
METVATAGREGGEEEQQGTDRGQIWAATDRDCTRLRHAAGRAGRNASQCYNPPQCAY